MNHSALPMRLSGLGRPVKPHPPRRRGRRGGAETLIRHSLSGLLNVSGVKINQICQDPDSFSKGANSHIMADLTYLFPIKASGSKVFNAISTPEGLNSWWTKTCSGS